MPATTYDDINTFRESVTGIVFLQDGRVAVPFKPALEGERITPVTVDIHITRIELEDREGAFIGHEIVSTEVILLSSRRKASMAV
ncbi:hypothetical protein D3C85_1378310 [compost metagenome]